MFIFMNDPSVFVVHTSDYICNHWDCFYGCTNVTSACVNQTISNHCLIIIIGFYTYIMIRIL